MGTSFSDRPLCLEDTNSRLEYLENKVEQLEKLISELCKIQNIFQCRGCDELHTLTTDTKECEHCCVPVAPQCKVLACKDSKNCKKECVCNVPVVTCSHSCARVYYTTQYQLHNPGKECYGLVIPTIKQM